MVPIEWRNKASGDAIQAQVLSSYHHRRHIEGSEPPKETR